jgi:hypothetical protein
MVGVSLMVNPNREGEPSSSNIYLHILFNRQFRVILAHLFLLMHARCILLCFRKADNYVLYRIIFNQQITIYVWRMYSVL